MKINSVLIIEDETDICLLLVSFFKRKNLAVSYSNTLSDGIVKFKNIQPDLLIIDHNLPDGFGINSIENFKKEKQSIYVVAISALSNLKSQAGKMGADYFMEKPISFSKLNELLDGKFA